MFKLIMIVMAILLLVGCADPTRLPNEAGRDRAGFWLGLWHGMIAPISFIVSLFKSDVAVYEVYNTGNWYVFGFLFGVGTFAVTTSQRKKNE